MSSKKVVMFGRSKRLDSVTGCVNSINTDMLPCGVRVHAAALQACYLFPVLTPMHQNCADQTRRQYAMQTHRLLICKPNQYTPKTKSHANITCQQSTMSWRLKYLNNTGMIND